MSHVVTIKSKVLDPAAVAAACKRLSLADPVHGTAHLFTGEATGLLVNLPGWKYPAVIDTSTGEVRYDNYQGSWGEQAQLDRFLQRYAEEKALLEARKKGFTVSEKTLQDSSIKVQIIES
jgi:hypothetical protein